MIIQKKNEISDEDIIAKLNENGFKAFFKIFLFGGRQIMVKDKGCTFLINNNAKEAMNVEIKVPIWVTIISLLVTMAVATLLVSALKGESVVVSGGVIVILIGIFGGNLVYSSVKSGRLNDFCKKTGEII